MNRRYFCLLSSAFALQLPAQSTSSFGSTRPDVAAVEHDRVLRLAESYLKEKPRTIASISAPRSPGTVNDYYSEAEDWFADADPKKPWNHRVNEVNLDSFHAHGDALFRFSLIVPALAAAWLLTKDSKYSTAAVAHLRAWFITAETRMNPALDHAQCIPGVTPGRGTGILETIHLTEVVRAISFLSSADEMSPADLKALKAWVGDYLRWMNDSIPGQAERDTRSIHGIGWVLQAGEYSRFVNNAAINGFCVKRFREVLLTLVSLDGNFAAALPTATPYLQSIYHLECLAAACEVLSTTFESLWSVQTYDGKGLRSAVAFLYPFLQDKGHWPYRADTTHFKDLPLRPISLLFAGRAYLRPEYAALWKSMQADPSEENIDLLRYYPLRQPLLWSRRVPTV